MENLSSSVFFISYLFLLKMNKTSYMQNMETLGLPAYELIPATRCHCRFVKVFVAFDQFYFSQFLIVVDNKDIRLCFFNLWSTPHKRNCSSSGQILLRNGEPTKLSRRYIAIMSYLVTQPVSVTNVLRVFQPRPIKQTFRLKLFKCWDTNK